MEPGSLLDISVKVTFEYFPKYVEKTQVSLKLQTISGYFTGRHVYTYNNISPILPRIRNVSDQGCRKN